MPASSDQLLPYRPGIDGPFGRTQANHLLRRSSFGGTAAERDALLDQGLPAAVERLTATPEPSGAFADELQLLDALTPLEDAQLARAAWVARMLHDPHPFRELLTLFWHGHFATSIEKVGRVRLMQRQVAMLRERGPGSLRALLSAVAHDPAMIIWLDGNANRRHHPNENFARELFELFTLGEGQYAEADVLEAARAFSGWHESGGRFRFAAGEHDDGHKQVLGASGTLDGEDVIDAALAHPACGEHVGSALFAYLVRPDPGPELRRSLGALYRESDYDTRSFCRALLQSRAFFAPESRLALVRSPVALAVGSVRSLGISVDSRALALAMADMGQSLLAPPSVKGWDGGGAWLNTATLLARANLAVALAQAGGPLGVTPSGDERPLQRVRDELLDLLVDGAVPGWVSERLVSEANSHAGLLAAILSLPEVQYA
ncbi:MAG: DUF1800 domain-containing protein [Planctomycetota bacterium]|nr:MAG: DUF1800 domain-containing protein [Planctomycetota bacterium]